MKIRIGRQERTVSWGLADRVVAWLSPKAGLERLRSRVAMDHATGVGGYNGGARDRRATRNWRPLEQSANETLSPDLPDLRARSRDLARNVPLATGAINTVVTNTVGDGLVLQSQLDRDVLNLSEEQADAWQRAAEREFAIWAKHPDFTSRLNFDEYQALVLRSVLESGDLFVARRRRFDAGATYGLKLQAIEADRVSNPNHRANRPDMVDGVAMDADGVPSGYSISTHYPDDVALGIERTWKTYDVGSTVTGTPLILHLYDQKRPGQARGIPYLSPVIEAVKQLGDYADAEVRAAVISAMFTVFVKPEVLEDDGDASFIGSNKTSDGVDPASEIALGTGAIVDLAPGEDVTFADPKRPNTAFDAFVTAMSRHIGVALELPYEILLKSFTASYSASRAALEMAWQFFRSRRSWLAWKFCQPVYEWVITEAVVAGRLAAPGYFDDPVIREAWLGSDWIGPSRIQLDPQKEASADMLDLNMGTKTRAQIITERTGGSFEAKHAQLAKEQRLRDEAGLTTAASASAAMQPPPQDQQPAADGTTATAFAGFAEAAKIQAEAARLQAEKPAANIHLPKVEVAVQMPEQLQPIVNVAVPPQATPIVHVAVPQQPPPVVNVKPPRARPKAEVTTVTKWDDKGRIVEFEKREID